MIDPAYLIGVLAIVGFWWVFAYSITGRFGKGCSYTGCHRYRYRESKFCPLHDYTLFGKE